MLVYKYRGGDKKIFERDIKSIEKNYFWSSSIDDLNDPCETLISSRKFIKITNWLSRFFGKKTNEALLEVYSSLENLLSKNQNLGIFSLSKTFKDELLWAHYANKHKGFCIEYDLNLLLESFNPEKAYSYSVIYKNKVPEISFFDLSKKDDSILRKMSSIKSRRWEYEKEYRIITNNYGEQQYNFNALKSIYFGMRIDSIEKDSIFKTLKERDIKFYQMQRIENSYKFEGKQIINPYFVEDSYLKQIPSSIINNTFINFEIIKIFRNNICKTGNISIELDSKTTKIQIKILSKFIIDHICHNYKTVFIYYFYKYRVDINKEWALYYLMEGKSKIEIKS